MLKYDEFKETLEKELEGAKDSSITVTKMNICQVNKKEDAFIISDEHNQVPEGTVGAVFYCNDLYKSYQEGAAINEMAAYMLSTASKHPIGLKNLADINFLKRNYKDHVQACLINRDANSEYLQEIVHKDFLDLSIIFKLVFTNNTEGVQPTITINNNLAKLLGTSLEELLELSNRQEYEIHTMTDVLCQLEKCDKDSLPKMDTFEMLVVCMKSHICSAGAILNTAALKELASYFKDDFYLLPSSIHEFIAVEALEAVSELRDIVMEVNQNVVDEADLLSNNVYRCNKETLEIEIV